MEATVNRAFETNVYLSLDQVPAIAVAYSAVVVKYKKYGSDTMVTKVLAASDWVNLGEGFYTIKWSEEDMDTIGTFFFTMTSAAFDNFFYSEFLISFSLAAAHPERCILSGNILDLNVEPSQNTAITARIARLPAQVGTSLITVKALSTVPDHLGNFQFPLPRGAKVVIEIQEAGIRHTITVPDQDEASLLALLPPIS